MQGGHNILNVATKKIITRRKVTEIPTPNHIIKLVEAIAKKDGVKSLKFVTSSIAGVEQTINTETDDNEEDDDYYYEPENDEELNDDEPITQSEIDEVTGVPAENNIYYAITIPVTISTNSTQYKTRLGQYKPTHNNKQTEQG